MGFLQAIFLAGTATFAVPVIIHLIFKLRKRRVVFSSLLFIRESVLRETRRLRLRDLILLLLRAATCILIALAFARPYRVGQVLAGGNGEQRQAVVLVLDDSPSMNAQEGGFTRWQLAMQKAAALCEERKPGDRVALIFASDPGRAAVELSGNFGATVSELRRERALTRRGDLTQGLRSGMDLLADAREPVRRVVLIGDQQATQVDRGAWVDVARLAAVATHPVRIEVETPYADAGRAPERLRNIAVTDVRAKSDVWIENQPIRFGVRVENYSDGEAPNLAVRLVVNGKELAKRTLGLGPRGNTEIELEAVFPHAGEAAGYVEVAAHDALPDDDRRYFALRLRDSLAAVVSEDHFREQNTFLDESYFLRVALDPTPRGTDTTPLAGGHEEPSASYVRVLPVEGAKLSAETLKHADLLFLCGLTELPPASLAAVEAAVKNGLGLVIFMGRSEGRIGEAFYNGAFFKDGKGLLPARPGSQYEGNLAEGRYNGLDAFAADHPIFKVFTAPYDAELREVKFLRNYQMNEKDLHAGAPEHPAGKVLATFNDGSPFLVERPFGKGKVLLFPFLPRPNTDTDLPINLNFPALVHQVVRYLAGVEASSSRSLLIGQQIEPADLGLPAETPFRIETPPPQPEKKELTAGQACPVDRPGLYSGAYSEGTLSHNVFWAGNLDPKESDLISEDLAALRALFTSNQTEPSATAEEGVKIGQQSSEELKSQAPDWRYFLLAAVVCLLLEVIVRDFWEG
ncbi:MAG: BatA and WFA domain-containing protein [Planctomycetota bacterium]|nr:BatA and WFA domain-containing protein [Planctomycetota bacterium]